MFANSAPYLHPRGLEKHYRPLDHRLGAPLIRELLAAFRRDEVSASVATAVRRAPCAVRRAPCAVRRWAIAQQVAHPGPALRAPASLRRGQCLKTVALRQLDATPHRWFRAALAEHGFPLGLYVDCHSFFFPQRPAALTQFGAAPRFYGVSLRYVRTPPSQG